MINTIKKTSSIILIAVMLIATAFAFNTIESNAASSYISCTGSVTQGNTFTATVVYTGDTYGVVVGSWSYDSSKFSLVSGSTSYSLYSDSGVGSLSASITLKANSTGTGYVSASTTSASNYNMENLSFSGMSASVTVNAASSGSGSSSSGGSSSSKSSKKSKTDDPQAEKEEAKTEQEDKHEKPSSIEVEIAGTKYTIVEDFKNIPNGFKKAEFTYGEYKWKVTGVKSSDGKYKLLKVKNSTTGDKTWFFYDEASSTLSPTTTIAGSELMEMYGNEGVEESKLPLIAVTVLGLAVIVLAGFLFGKSQKIKELTGATAAKQAKKDKKKQAKQEKAEEKKYESKH